MSLSRKRQRGGDVIDLSESGNATEDPSLVLAQRLEAEENQFKEEQYQKDAAMAARLASESGTPGDPAAGGSATRRGGGRVRGRRPSANRCNRRMNVDMLSMIMRAVAGRSGELDFLFDLSARPQIPEGIDPRLAELMTRDLTANDYETLMELEQASAATGAGANDGEINLLPTFTFGGKKAKVTCSSGSGGKCRKYSKISEEVVSLLDDSDEEDDPQPYSSSSFEKQQQQEEEEEEEEKCAVCLETFEGGDKCIRLPCLHYFHEDCIREWLRIQKCCPVDKKAIDES